MARVYLSLGCNVGDCHRNLEKAIARLGDEPRIEVSGVSSVYITEPVGRKDQPEFFNMAVELETSLAPEGLLGVCRGVEEALGGRDGREPMGPRSIDLDILLYEQVKIAHGELEIPHPRMLERAFVMVPLSELAPGLELPDGRTVAHALDELDDPHAVRKADAENRLTGG